MNIINPNSVAATLDAVDEALFFETRLSQTQKQAVAKWIASRQGLPGSYADTFAPTEGDRKDGIRVFTGESIRTGVATAHILGEEACRALILLDVPSATVREALSRASRGLLSRVEGAEAAGQTGTYCCGICSVSFWRHLAVGGLGDCERRLESGMQALKSRRDGNGRWGRFPFYYSLLVLTDIAIPSALQEMRYAAPLCERYLRRSPREDAYDRRRRALAERVLARC
jgi:hypothetical protein